MVYGFGSMSIQLSQTEAVSKTPFANSHELGPLHPRSSPPAVPSERLVRFTDEAEGV